MNKFQLKIITPQKIIFDDSVEEVLVNTPMGQIGILAHHTNLMTQLEPGELIVKTENKQNVWAIGEGFLQMTNNSLVILADLAVTPSEINEKEVEEARLRAKEALAHLKTDEEIALTEAVLEKSIAQLQVKRRHHSRLPSPETSP